RIRGLHDAVGDAPREIVLEERPALAHDVPVALPADQAGGARYQRVLADRDVDQYHERAEDEYKRDHAEQQRPLLPERRGPVDGFHQRHELADEYRDHGVDQRDGEARDEHERIPALSLAREVPVKGDQPGRRGAGAYARRSADA